MHAVAIETIAEVNMRGGKYAEAASQFDAAIKLNEAHGMKSRGGVPYLYECLGACLFMIQDYENASLAFAKAKTLGADAEHIDRKIQACLDRRLDDAAVVAMWN